MHLLEIRDWWFEYHQICYFIPKEDLRKFRDFVKSLDRELEVELPKEFILHGTIKDFKDSSNHPEVALSNVRLVRTEYFTMNMQDAKELPLLEGYFRITTESGSTYQLSTNFMNQSTQLLLSALML